MFGSTEESRIDDFVIEKNREYFLLHNHVQVRKFISLRFQMHSFIAPVERFHFLIQSSSRCLAEDLMFAVYLLALEILYGRQMLMIP